MQTKTNINILMKKFDYLINHELNRIIKTKTIGYMTGDDFSYNKYAMINKSRNLTELVVIYKIHLLVDGKIISKEYFGQLLKIYHEYEKMKNQNILDDKYIEYSEILREFDLINNEIDFSNLFRDSYLGKFDVEEKEKQNVLVKK